jgi:glycosyltransferase involved in cell wall biosynthesis
MKLHCFIPVYNTPCAIFAKAVMSILEQSYKDFELYIYSDGSSMANVQEYVRFLTAIDDKRLKFFYDTVNRGLSGALNILNRMSNAEYCARMDSDDISCPERFARQMDYLDKHREVDILGCSLAGFVVENTFLWHKSHPAVVEAMPENNWVHNHGTVIYKRRSIVDLGGYDEKILRGQDIDLWKRSFAAGLKMHNIQDELYYYRRY